MLSVHYHGLIQSSYVSLVAKAERAEIHDLATRNYEALREWQQTADFMGAGESPDTKPGVQCLLSDLKDGFIITDIKSEGVGEECMIVASRSGVGEDGQTCSTTAFVRGILGAILSSHCQENGKFHLLEKVLIRKVILLFL